MCVGCSVAHAFTFTFTCTRTCTCTRARNTSSRSSGTGAAVPEIQQTVQAALVTHLQQQAFGCVCRCRRLQQAKAQGPFGLSTPLCMRLISQRRGGPARRAHRAGPAGDGLCPPAPPDARGPKKGGLAGGGGAGGGVVVGVRDGALPHVWHHGRARCVPFFFCMHTCDDMMLSIDRLKMLTTETPPFPKKNDPDLSQQLKPLLLLLSILKGLPEEHHRRGSAGGMDGGMGGGPQARVRGSENIYRCMPPTTRLIGDQNPSTIIRAVTHRRRGRRPAAGARGGRPHRRRPRRVGARAERRRRGPGAGAGERRRGGRGAPGQAGGAAVPAGLGHVRDAGAGVGLAGGHGGVGAAPRAGGAGGAGGDGAGPGARGLLHGAFGALLCRGCDDLASRSCK